MLVDKLITRPDLAIQDAREPVQLEDTVELAHPFRAEGVTVYDADGRIVCVAGSSRKTIRARAEIASRIANLLNKDC